MAGPDDKGKSNDLDLDVKMTDPAGTNVQADELVDGDMNKVAGGLKPNNTIQCQSEAC